MSDEQQQSAEHQSFLELTRSLTSLPLDQAAAVLETSASIAAISLRAGIEFLRAAPSATQVLQPTELRAWGEMGRRLAMADYESAAAFFGEGVESLKAVAPELRTAIFVLWTRQRVHGARQNTAPSFSMSVTPSSMRSSDSTTLILQAQQSRWPEHLHLARG